MEDDLRLSSLRLVFPEECREWAAVFLVDDSVEALRDSCDFGV